MMQEDTKDAEGTNTAMDQKKQQQRLQPSFLLSSPICRQEIAIILPMLALRCRHPTLHIQVKSHGCKAARVITLPVLTLSLLHHY